MHCSVKALYSAAVVCALVGSAVAAPTITNPLPDLQIGHTGTPTVVSLAGRYADPGTSVVRMVTNLGNIDVALFDQAKPVTVTNFKNYIVSGRYVNTIVHRSAQYSAGNPFVLQVGGFKRPNANNAAPGPVSTFAPIINEPGISNLRGTLAMAKLGGNPHSATSQWFFNMTDRNATDPTGAKLDTQNGGFTVFARVLAGMSVLDYIANNVEQTDGSEFYNNGALDELPLISPQFQPVTLIEPTDFVTFTSMFSISGYPTLTYTATSDKPDTITVAVVGSQLSLTTLPGKSGTATITVTAKSPDTSFVVDSFLVTLRCSPADIADDQGNPGPGSEIFPNTGVNEGDYNAFFGGFFDAMPYCDIADDQGNPLPPVGGAINSGVNEGDYNAFFAFFFGGC